MGELMKQFTHEFSNLLMHSILLWVNNCMRSFWVSVCGLSSTDYRICNPVNSVNFLKQRIGKNTPTLMFYL